MFHTRCIQSHRHKVPRVLSQPRRYNLLATCPPPTCNCLPTPTGLDIDHKLPLEGTVPPYNGQVLISTGKSDWTSRIEDDKTGALARELKRLLGPKGKYFNPDRNAILTCSSFPTSSALEDPQRLSSGASADDGISTSMSAASDKASSTSVCLFPSFLYVPNVTADAGVAETFVKQFLLGEEKAVLGSQDRLSGTESLLKTETIQNIVVLVCSHESRDSRCGILGPLVLEEFANQLRQTGYKVSTTPARESEDTAHEVLVGAISHIGGHRWAGNVIIYVSPTMTDHPLAGRGIWYGRVTPQHVEGIVHATIQQGSIIRDLFRGGIEPTRAPLRLPTISS